MKKLVAENSFWELFPDAAIGILAVRDMRPAAEVPPEDAAAVARLLRDANEQANRHLTSNTISENEAVRVWRETYRMFKTKKGARCSIENLLKRVLKGNPVGSISPSVDLYNAISLKYALPLGGEDLDAFEGDLRLRITEGGDAFTPLGEGAENDPTLPGELAYVDDAGAVCRCWNWRDGVRTMLTESTTNAFLILESVDPARHDDLAAALDDLAARTQAALGGEMESHIVTKDSPAIALS